MKLNIDRAILRDIMEARATNERRNSYYVVGSIFSGMSFTMLLLGSDNYTAISALVMVGMMFYSCISCNKIDFEETDCGANGAGEKNKECDEQEEAEEPYMKVDELTLDEKINLFTEMYNVTKRLQIAFTQNKNLYSTYLDEKDGIIAIMITKGKVIELLKEETANVAKVREQLHAQLLDIQKEQTIMAEQLEDYRSVMNQYPFMEAELELRRLTKQISKLFKVSLFGVFRLKHLVNNNINFNIMTIHQFTKTFCKLTYTTMWY
jgi:hypothetical protein